MSVSQQPFLLKIYVDRLQSCFTVSYGVIYVGPCKDGLRIYLVIALSDTQKKVLWSGLGLVDTAFMVIILQGLEKMLLKIFEFREISRELFFFFLLHWRWIWLNWLSLRRFSDFLNAWLSFDLAENKQFIAIWICMSSVKLFSKFVHLVVEFIFVLRNLHFRNVFHFSRVLHYVLVIHCFSRVHFFFSVFFLVVTLIRSLFD